MAHVPAVPMVGRDAEVAALLAATTASRAGEPRCVVVTGEAGIGKTRLIADVLADLDALVLTGRGADMTAGEIPFGVLADTLRDLSRQRGSQALTATEASVLAPLLPGGSASGSVEPARIHACALDLFGRLCADQLLVWVVEDLHWADAATRDLVSLTARSLRGRILLVVTVRTGDPTRSPAEEGALNERVTSLLRVSHTTRVDLQRLTPDQVRALVHSLTDVVPPTDVQTITRLSDGVPFFVEELTAAHGHPEQSTAGAALAARTTMLGTSARRLVEAAAVGDGHLRLSLVEQVLDTAPDEFDAALVDAVHGSVLTCDPDSDQLAFRHALLRESVNAALGPGARRAWHRRWAEVLEQNPGVLATDPAALAVAEHWHHARDVARSVSAAYAAAPAARRVLDEARRLVLWQRILEGWEHRDPATPVGRLTFRQAIGEALKGPLGWDQLDERILDGFLAAATAGPVALPERVLLELIGVGFRSAKTGTETRDVAVMADRQVDWLDQPADDLTRDALVHVGDNLPPSESERAGLLLRRAEELYRTDGDHDGLVRVVKARANLLAEAGDVPDAARLLEEGLSALRPDQVRHRLSFAGDLAWAYVGEGRHADADRLLTEHLQRTPHLEAMVSQWEHVVENAVFTWLCTGQWQRVRKTMEQASPWWPDDLRVSNLWLARLDLLQYGATSEGRWRDELGAPIPNGPAESDLRAVLAHAAGLRGDLATMRELVAPRWEDAADDESIWWPVVAVARAEVAIAVEDPRRRDRGQASAHLDRMTHALTEAPYVGPHEQATALELAAQTDRFHSRDPREALEAVLAAWTAIDHVPDVAVTHLSLAEAHSQAGDRDTARTHLDKGRRIATELDARLWLDRAAAIAHRYAFTTRERRPAEVFTGRELEVLELLAEGRTNKEIAATLFISPKTASVHVSRIITKTGATNRTEAVANARRHGLLAGNG